MATVSANNTRVDASDSTTNWGNDGGGGGVALEPDVFYQGTASNSRKIGTTRLGRAYTDPGAGEDIVLPATKHWMAKLQMTNPGASVARTAPGFGIKIGSSSANYYEVYLFGAAEYPATAGWALVPITTDVFEYIDAEAGTVDPSAITFYSLLADFTGTSKVENVIIDAIDLGLGLNMTGTPAGSWQDFVDFDEGTTTNRFGYVTTNGLIVLVNGTLAIGQNTSGTATETAFVDTTGRPLVWQNGWARNDFHKLLFDLGNASTIIDLQNATLISTGEKSNTVGGIISESFEDTRTNMEVVGTSGTWNFQRNTLKNFGLITLSSAATLDDCDIEAQRIIQNSADIENCTLRPNGDAAEAMFIRDFTFGTTTDLNNCAFIQSGSGHVFEINDFLGGETAPAFQGGSSTGWPTHAADDVAFLFTESSAGDRNGIDTPEGFQRFVEATTTTTPTTSTRVTGYWKRATSSSETNPSGVGGSDHQAFYYIVYRNMPTDGFPCWDVVTSFEDTASTTANAPSIDTVYDNQKILMVTATGDSGAGGNNLSGQTNGNLTVINEQFDEGDNSGNAGGVGGFDAQKTTAGATGTTTITDANSAAHAHIGLLLKGTPSKSVTQVSQTGISSSTGGDVTRSWPTHQADDVAFMIAESEASDGALTLATPAGFALVGEVASSTGGNETRLTVWWKRAASASETSPVVEGTGLDHIAVAMTVFRGLRTTGNPWSDFQTAADNTDDTSTSYPSATSLQNADLNSNQMIAGFLAHGNTSALHSGLTNANLGSPPFSEDIDSNHGSGSGGGLVAWHAGHTSGATTGATTATLSAASKTAAMTMVLVAEESSYNLDGLTYSGFGANGANDAVINLTDSDGHYLFNVTNGDTPTIKSQGASWEIIQSVTITVNVEDPDGNAIEGARVRVETDPAAVLVTDGETNASGVFQDTVSYTADQDVTIRVRLKGWLPFETTGEILNTGLTTGATLNPDPIVDLP